MIFVVYVDNAIIFGPDNDKINAFIKSMRPNYKLTDEGDLKEYLGLRVDCMKEGGLLLTQPTLTKRILSTVGLTPGNGARDTPSTKQLKDANGPKREQS